MKINYKLLAETLDQKSDNIDKFLNCWFNKIYEESQVFKKYRKAILFIWDPMKNPDSWPDFSTDELEIFANIMNSKFQDPIYTDIISSKYNYWIENMNKDQIKKEFRRIAQQKINQQKKQYLNNLGFTEDNYNWEEILNKQPDNDEIWER